MNTNGIKLEFVETPCMNYGFTRESVQGVAAKAMAVGKRVVPLSATCDKIRFENFEVDVTYTPAGFTHTPEGYVRYYVYINNGGALSLIGEMAHGGQPVMYTGKVKSGLAMATTSSRIDRSMAFALLLFAAVSPTASWKEAWASVLSNM